MKNYFISEKHYYHSMCGGKKTLGFLISAFERDTIENEIKRYNISIAEIFQKPFSLTNLAKSVNEYAHINDVRTEKENKQ